MRALRWKSCLALAALGALGADCVAPPPPVGPLPRIAEARPESTIFSPLAWPAPSRLRTAAGLPGPDYWQQEADYEIAAHFDPEQREILGRERIRYVNRSPDELPYLWLNLDANVFRSDSIGVRVGERSAIGIRSGEGQGLELLSVRVDGEPVPCPVFDTLARVELARPLAAAGGSLELAIEWRFQIPRSVFRRFGSEELEQGEIFQVAQWFPNLAVYDDVHGWNTLPYVGTGEFYTNYGDYDVRLTVPRDHLVVATGELQNPGEVLTAEQCARLERARTSRETVLVRGPDEVLDPASRPAGEGELTWHFRARRVRTFAWASSPAFVLDAASVDGVLCQSAYPKEALPLWSEATAMLAAAIADYGARWYRYPYPVAINVNGPEAGMEYPMIVFCRERKDERGLYGLVAHEIGHNWFPMTVNTDERRHMWMDEGFNTFINYYADEAWFGSHTPGRAAPAPLAQRLREELAPIETPPDRLPPQQMGELQYTKAGAGLVLLREVILGPERFDYAFRTYIERWAFRSPRPWDFFRCMESAAGADLAWFWRGWFYETAWLDQALVGWRPAAEGRPARIVLESKGELVMPVRYRLLYAGGRSEDHELPVEVWFHTRRIEESLPPGPLPEAVVLDPDELLPDLDRANNRLAL